MVDPKEKQRLCQYDMLHVAREGADILEASNSPIYNNGKLTNVDFTAIINALYTKGIGAGHDKRSPDSHRINFSYKNTGDPISFPKVCNNLPPNEAKHFLKQIDRILSGTGFVTHNAHPVLDCNAP